MLFQQLLNLIYADKDKIADRRELQFPQEAIHDNYIVTRDGDLWAGYYISPQDFPLNKGKFKNDYISQMSELVESENLEFHFMNIPKYFDIEKHTEETIKALVHGELKDVGEYYFKRAGKILKEEVQMNEYHTYLFVKLNAVIVTNNPIEILEVLKRDIKDSLDNLNGVGISSTHIPKTYQEQEQRFYRLLRSSKNARRLSEREIRQINYYQYHRMNKIQPERYISDLEMNEGAITSHRGYMTIEQNNGTNYIAFIPIVTLLNEVDGSMLIQNVQNMVSFPLETQIRVYHRSVSMDKSSAKRKRMTIFNQNKERRNVIAGEDDDVHMSGYERLGKLQRNLSNHTEVLIRMSVTFVIAADSKEELEKRIDSLFFVFKDSPFTIYRPVVDQLKLFHESIPGSNHELRLFDQITNTQYFANLGIDLTRNVGNKYGMPLGRIITGITSSGGIRRLKTLDQAIASSSKVVNYFPALTKKAIRGAQHTNGNTLIVGPPGQGKSFLVKDIFLFSSFMGQHILYIDPKNETEKFVKKAAKKYHDVEMFQKLVSSINFISLSSDEAYRGLLDPFKFLDGPNAAEIAISVLAQLGTIEDSIDTNNKKSTITKAVKTISEKPIEQRSMNAVISIIKEKDSELYDLIDSYQNGLGKVILGNNDSVAIDLSDQINVLGLEGLVFQKDDDMRKNRKPTNPQIVSVAIMSVIMKMTTVFSTDKSEDAAVIFDEAKAVEYASDGDMLIDQSLRQGRANNTDVYLVTQSFSDYDKDEKKELISYKFAFQPKADEMREKLLSFFNMDINNANLKMFDNLIPGTCLFQDHLGRNQVIAIDVLFEEWKEAISSTDQSAEYTQTALRLEEVTDEGE